MRGLASWGVAGFVVALDMTDRTGQQEAKDAAAEVARQIEARAEAERQLEIELAEFAKKEEEARLKKIEDDKVAARWAALAEMERKTKRFFDVDDSSQRQLEITTTGGVYFGEYEVLGDDDKEVQVHRHLYILHSGGCTFSAKAIVVLSPGTTLSPPRVTPVWQDNLAQDDEEDEAPFYICMTPIGDADIKDARAGHLLVAWAKLATDIDLDPMLQQGAAREYMRR